MATLEFFYDLGSPYSYLASTQLEGMRQRTGGKVRTLPIALGGLRKLLGTQMPSPAQLQYISRDVGRWAKKYSVPIAFPASFPARTITALRVCVATGGEAEAEKAMHALFHAYWGLGEDIGEPAVMEKALASAGLDATALLARSEEEGVKEALKRNTSLALDRGVFGVPMMFVGERSFWGNDRLEFAEAALREACQRGEA